MRTLTLTLAALALTACARTPQPLDAPTPTYVYAAGRVPDSLIVRLATTKGDIDILLRTHWAPRGVGQFYEAVHAHYYDGARFFRAIRGFVVQFGIAADPAASAQWRTRTIDDDPVLESNRRGTVVFASGGPNTRTVQMFINLRDNARLDGLGFPPIGEVIAGMDAVDALYTGYGDGPTAPDQGRLNREGEAYVAADFPLLDQIKTARIVRVWGPATP
jgi:peptidyl-prolyl cis-trans isomerase A (cyclophilin A)